MKLLSNLSTLHRRLKIDAINFDVERRIGPNIFAGKSVSDIRATISHDISKIHNTRARLDALSAKVNGFVDIASDEVRAYQRVIVERSFGELNDHLTRAEASLKNCLETCEKHKNERNTNGVKICQISGHVNHYAVIEILKSTNDVLKTIEESTVTAMSSSVGSMLARLSSNHLV